MNAVCGDDVVTVAEFLKARQPPLMELSSFVNTFEVRQVQLRSTRLRVEEAIFECAVIPYRLPETIRSMECYSWLMSEVGETFEKEGAESIAEKNIKFMV
ncbi:hypothetical protein GQ600_15280 [Phytophthora cactorum]|nr:hypothetical protein GQ600_15280 [Phytophthora cactorum]